MPTPSDLPGCGACFFECCAFGTYSQLDICTRPTGLFWAIVVTEFAGQERFGNMTRVYYKEAAGAIVVFDSTRAATYEGALRWKADLDQKVRLADGRPIPSILLANKCDLDESTMSEAELSKCCEENGFIGAYSTSAKENIGIDDAASFLAGHVLAIKRSGQYEIPLLQQDGDVRRLGNGLTNGTHKRRANSVTTKQKCCG